MPVPSAISDLSTTASSNSPPGSESVFPDLDGYLRAHAAFIAQLRAGTGLADSAIATAKLADSSVTGAKIAASQTITSPTISGGTHTGAIYDNGSVRSNIVAVSALDIDCSQGNYFTKTISANSTFTFSNAPSSRAFSFTFELTHTSGTVTWPTTVRWPGGTAPTLTTGKTHVFVFVTDDGGTLWRGASLVDYAST